jgi:hypothetical protein
MKRRLLGVVGSSMLWLLMWAGCSTVDRPGGGAVEAGHGGEGADDGTAGSSRGGSQSGASGSGSLTAGSAGVGNASFGGSSDVGGSANAGQGGTEVGGEGPTTGGSNNPPKGECEDGDTESCGDCGTRICDASTLKWGACKGDGKQEACWKDENGVALPGTIFTEPKGSCHAGQQTCQADGAWSKCTGAVAPATTDDCNVAGNDANCDGTPNGGCNCVSGAMRVCGKDTGNCKTGMQTCTSQVWGNCEGEIKPAAVDSCATTGDDANCNDMPNEGCSCTPGNQATTCNDALSCTNDICNNGVCTNQIGTGACLIGANCVANGALDPTNGCRYCDAGLNKTGWTPASSTTACESDGVSCTNDFCNGSGACTHAIAASSCLIGGSCVANNTKRSGNPCQYCDVSLSKTEWSNSSSSTSCDDGLWCNGDDTCNGGACQHQFTGNRCTATGACALTVCDEARDSCFKPTSSSCGTSTEKQCTSTSACSGDVQTRTLTQFCSGNSVDCNGTTSPGNWTTSLDCSADQKCNGSSFSCVNTLGCGSTWCSGGTCWTLNNDTKTLAAAKSFCSSLNLGGNADWELASIDDYLAFDFGCNGTTGTATTLPSTCHFGANYDEGTLDCGSCPDTKGPGNTGCYWLAGMGTCNRTGEGYWSSSRSSFGQLGFDPKDNTVFFYPLENEALPYRCTVKP